ncbi:hypothetical protein PCANC_20383 [Puccinia coronata f. sp. avenae]|uniref:Uncharacterized protein n=1 Tax=Puccinia coronata f. sp. avenae TaxID=200324 RepID=A0A2N5UMT9_9BASI|nr:hypothetical protein PCANC_20383 [Puccinia coronata f. sp. avenae]PLW38956.1 hypothetical protein PCASD_11714 [Puccinia coronata f. sp. avenae]
MAMKLEPSKQNPALPTDRVDLQKFRMLDGPTFHGPFQEVKPFLRWINGVQILCDAKGVTNSANKIRIVGSLIGQTNLLAFYANESHKFINKPSKTFMGYSTRARTLQHMLNFKKESIINFKLAEWVTFGLTNNLASRVYNHQLLQAAPFVYSKFKSRVAGFFISASKGTPTSTHWATLPPVPSGRSSREDFIWRIHAYLDSQGRCHFCKKTCGNVAGACPGPVDRSLIDIPASFKAPPKPADYVPPRAWGGSQSTAGKPVQPPAGRAPVCSTTVAAVAGENYFPKLDSEAIAAIAAIDKEVCIGGVVNGTATW